MKLIISLILLICPQLYSDFEIIESSFEAERFEEDMAEVIISKQGNKLYIDPDCISVSRGGLSLVLRGGEVLPITRLASNNHGCYIKSDELLPTHLDASITPFCRECRQPRSIFSPCRNPICPLNPANNGLDHSERKEDSKNYNSNPGTNSTKKKK